MSSFIILVLKILKHTKFTSLDYKWENLSDLLNEYEVLDGELLRG
jgi:hypothetical protein